MAALPASPTDRAPPVGVGPMVMPVQTTPPMMVADAFAKDAILAWFRGEFAAANAIIDALCSHLVKVGGASEYEAVFAAIHRRRLNWIPVLQMQKYHSIADVAVELRRVTERKMEEERVQSEKKCEEEEEKEEAMEAKKEICTNKKERGREKVTESFGHGDGGDGGEVVEEEEDSPDSDITDSVSQEMQANCENINICTNHEDCKARTAQIKLTKGFTAKEQVKGHMVNVVKGLKLYEDVLMDSELSRLTDFVNELRAVGHKGELSGETFILFNKQIKGNRTELIQLGIPIFGHIQEEGFANCNQTSNLEPIPALLQGVIDHLIQWQLIPEYKKPNGCIIHFFDEGEYSQPFMKPPHLDQPICTLLLSESTMAFGHILMSDNDGNCRGPLMLSLKEGSLLVMRGHSADMARHVMCPSPNKRISLTFFRVRPESYQVQSPPTSPMSGATTLWQPGISSPFGMPNGALSGYEAMDATPKWGVLRGPVVMLAPVRPVAMSPKRMPRDGTGVFLPWTVGSRKHAKHLPPRAQKGRFLALPSPVESHVGDSASEMRVSAEGKSA